MDLKVFNELVRRVEAIKERIGKMHRDQSDLRLKKWLDNGEVCETLGITKRTLQTYRENGMLPFSRIRYKVFYKPGDVQRLLDSYRHSKRQPL